MQRSHPFGLTLPRGEDGLRPCTEHAWWWPLRIAFPSTCRREVQDYIPAQLYRTMAGSAWLNLVGQHRQQTQALSPHQARAQFLGKSLGPGEIITGCSADEGARRVGTEAPFSSHQGIFGASQAERLPGQNTFLKLPSRQHLGSGWPWAGGAAGEVGGAPGRGPIRWTQPGGNSGCRLALATALTDRPPLPTPGLLSALPMFGSSFFFVQSCSNAAVPAPCILAVNQNGLNFLSTETHVSGLSLALPLVPLSSEPHCLPGGGRAVWLRDLRQHLFPTTSLTCPSGTWG